ncbi:MAG TPA: hypothetical protein VNS79_10770 [Sphingobium sp.]|nr:hypothetical protein [Sphingobium sp.]
MALTQLADRNAFITGGASGIGLGMAKAFVRQGMREKFDKMLRSLPTAQDDPELVKDLAMFTSNPIYKDDA